jgi:YadA-like membrane anchor domain
MKFRISAVVLGVLAVLGSGQVMAEAIVTSNGTTQTDRISYDIPSNTAGMNISGSASYATSAGSATTATTALGVSSNSLVNIQGNNDGNIASGEGVRISSNLDGGVGGLASDQAYVTVYSTGNASVAGTTQAAMYSGSNYIATSATNGNYLQGGTVINGTTTINSGLTSIGNFDMHGVIYNSGSNNSGAVAVDDALTVTQGIYTYGNATIGAGNATTVTIGSVNAGSSTTVRGINNTIFAGPEYDSNGNPVTGTGVNTITGVVNNVTGTTNINTGSGTAVTTIGSYTNTGAVNIRSGAAAIEVDSASNKVLINGNTSANTQIGSVNSTGWTWIGGDSSSAAYINAQGATGTTYIGNATGATNINAGVAGTTNIGTGNVASTTNIGSAHAGASVRAAGGDSALSLANGTASLGSGTASGYTAYSSAQTVGAAHVTLVNGNTASQALVNGASVNNVIKGNTLVDGNMYINGTLVYSSNTSATTTVTGSNTVSGMTVVNAGQTGFAADANGKITTGATTTEATAALTVTNSLGNTHGVVVQESKTTLSGGNNSSSMTLDDSGATFSNSATGAPVTVTGVADGKQDFDAVNVRQFAGAVAGVAAMANIPVPQVGESTSVGVGLGNFMGKSALAFGFNHRLSANAVIKASLSSGLNGGTKPVFGAGAAWSW